MPPFAALLDVADHAGAVIDVVQAAPRRAMPRPEVVAMLRDIGLTDEEALAVVGFALRAGGLVEGGHVLRAR